MMSHRGKVNTFRKLDFENSHLVPEYRCYYDENNDDYLLSKASLFHLLQKYNPSEETSRQIASEFQANSYQSADLSKMISLKEFAKSSQFSPAQLKKIKQDIYFLDYDSWFQVDQNGDIFLTNQMLLEALQQISKSRDDKFFSEHFSYIAKDFDPTQPSQYPAQSFNDYKDWIATLSQDKILKSNIEQLKIKCQSGQEKDIVNLQNFLHTSELSDDLRQDIKNYFRNNLFIKNQTSTSSATSCPTSFQPATLKIQTKSDNIILLLLELNSLKNSNSVSKINSYENKKIVRTQNSTFIFDEISHNVYQYSNQFDDSVPFYEEIWSYDQFLQQLNKQIAQEKRNSRIYAPVQPAQAVYQPHHPPQIYVPQAIIHYPYGTQLLQPIIHQATNLVTNLNTPIYHTFSTIHGAQINYPDNMLSYNPNLYFQNGFGGMVPSIAHSALQYSVGGGAMAMGVYHQMSGRGYGDPYATYSSQPMPRTAVHPSMLVNTSGHYGGPPH